MKLSVYEQLVKFLQDRRGETWPNGELQRIEWRNKNGTLATPRSVARRLEEAVNDGLLDVVYTQTGTASYKAKEEKIPIKYRYEPQVMPDGTVVMREVVYK